MTKMTDVSEESATFFLTVTSIGGYVFLEDPTMNTDGLEPQT